MPIKKGVLIAKGNHQLECPQKPDLSVFDDSEKETLKYVAKLAAADGGKKLLNLSHEEKGHKNTQSFNHISYRFAEELKI